MMWFALVVIGVLRCLGMALWATVTKMYALVCAVGKHLKVIGVDTPPVFADVMRVVPLWHINPNQSERDSMCLEIDILVITNHTQTAMTLGVDIPRPTPAAVRPIT
jgi:hypothetical protein